MRIVSITNQKGGAGKTTTTVNLAAAAAEAGHRVLVVDWDPQGHLTRTALAQPLLTDDVNLGRVVLREGPDIREVIRPYRERLDLIPSSDYMFLLEPRMYGQTARERLLSRTLQPVAADYDMCLIDAPPSLGVMTDNALVAAGESEGGFVVVPTLPEDYAFSALEMLFDQIASVNEAFRLDIAVRHFIVNAYDARRGKAVVQNLDGLREFAAEQEIPFSVIPDRVDIRDALRYTVAVIEHAPSSEVAGIYRNIVGEILPSGVKG